MLTIDSWLLENPTGIDKAPKVVVFFKMCRGQIINKKLVHLLLSLSIQGNQTQK